MNEHTNKKDPHRYDDIIDMKRPISKNHPPMDVENRAAQFAPFAALTGFGDAVDETGRLTDQKIELDENTKEILDEKMGRLVMLLEQGKRPEVSFTHFIKDLLKDGGKYVTTRGYVKKIDVLKKLIVMEDANLISTEDIIEIHFAEVE